MASIKNSISLQDRMSPVLRSVMKSMDSTLRVMQNLDRQSNKGVQSKAYQAAQKDIQRANNQLIKMQNNLDRADKMAGNLSKSTGQINNNMSRIGAHGFNLANLAAGVYLLKNAANALTGIMETPDSLNAIQYRLSTFDTTGATPQQLFDASYMAAMNSRSDIDSTANLAARVLATGATGGNGAQAIRLAELLNKSSFLGGSSAQESRNALMQLSQALASGALQGDELRSIRENAPGLTDVLSRGLSSMADRGVLSDRFLNTTIGDLKQLGAEGELTTGRIIAAFQEMGGYIDSTFEDSPKQFGQAMTMVGNIWSRFLKMLSVGDGALARINDKAWELVGWLESASGTKFLETLATGITFVVDGIIQLIDWIGDLIGWFNGLENSSQILQAAFITLGVVAAYAAIQAAIAWGIAAWPILLVVSLVGVLIYSLLQAGVTAGEIIGGIAGGFLFLAYLLYDVVIGALVAVGAIGVGAGMLIIMAIQGVVQIILWAVLAIWSALVTVYNVLFSIVKGAYGVVKGAIVGIYQVFVWLGQGVLGILWAIAKAIDFVFGSNLSGTVGGWIDGLGKSVEDLNKALDPLGEFEDIGNQWKDSYSTLGDMFAGKGQYDDWNITDKMGDVWNGGTAMIQGIADWGNATMLNPMDGWDSGYTFGADIANKMESFDFNLEKLIGGNGTIGINGGNLDSVGKINSDVEIKDEDLKLLRDMAARDFLLNLQHVTPIQNNKFGDIRETADVNKIMDALTEMVEEGMATSLIVN
ncbi:MAG: tape measure protein [Anaerovoracaceae bacterium]|jgi:tape measure domain-containing protein